MHDKVFVEKDTLRTTLWQALINQIFTTCTEEMRNELSIARVLQVIRQDIKLAFSGFLAIQEPGKHKNRCP